MPTRLLPCHLTMVQSYEVRQSSVIFRLFLFTESLELEGAFEEPHSMHMFLLPCVYYRDAYERREVDEQKRITQSHKITDFITNDVPSKEQKRGTLLSFRDGNPFQGKVRFLFPKIHPCLTRDSNPNPLDYKPSSIATILDGDRFNSCQVIYSQFRLAIHQNDHQARRRFVEWAQNEIAVVPDFHKRILFSDEAHFWLNGYVNKQNCRIWSEANPQVYVETPLHPGKLTVWCALWAGGILLQKR
ncbi:hypothetical protein TNCV_863561 [Trichonephila clavipes]|nr:hypothetical protein TNCV_863561 [Trichonephila clavipes]